MKFRHGRSRSSIISIIITISCCAIYLLFNYISSNHFVDQYDGWVETTATVTSYQERGYGDLKRYITNYSYSVDEKHYTGTVEQDANKLESQYNFINIKYNPDNPEDHTIITESDLFDGGSLYPTLAVIAIAVCILMLIIRIISSLRIKRQIDEVSSEEYILNGQEEDV